MAGMGVAPKHPSQRRRNNSTIQKMHRLPAEGRRGIAPDWPMNEPPTPDQRQLWALLWHTPQAAAWETLGWTRVVCRYTRLLLIAESTLAAASLNEVRQMEDRLGLSPMSMRRLGWEIEGGPSVLRDGGGGAVTPVTPISDYRQMFKDDDEGA